ncbi:MAG: tryptophan-rich sensory protein [Nitrospiraceae bacterium]|nr:MAG: tryptophan-rich sensory protein [Nitrospiraceae bacterium]
MKYYHYIFSPLFYIGVAMAGRFFTRNGLNDWYPFIVKPPYTPPGNIIGMAWTTIFILTAISLILFINAGRNKTGFWPVVSLYILNGIVNAAWSYFFFTRHWIGLAVIDSACIAVTVLLMIIFAGKHSRPSAILLFPYLGWVSFATFLTYVIYRSN